jgi:AcrR family transcriptional regulator
VPTSSRRTRRPRGSLSPELILDAAEAVAAQGFDALTMRAVAARVDAVPMALYNHFATKVQLVDALLDRVLSRFAPAPPSGDWIEDLRAFARSHRRLLAEHAWAVAPLFTQPNPGLGAVRIGEHALGILDRGGLSKDRSVAAFSGLIALNYGWSAFAVPRAAGAPGTDITAALLQLPKAAFPVTVEVAAEMGDYASDRHYELVLEQFLAGVRPHRTASRRTA